MNPVESISRSGGASAPRNLRAVGQPYFDRLLERCRSLPRLKVAVCHPCSEESLAGALASADAGLIEPILVGPRGQIGALAAAQGRELSGLRLVDAEDEAASAAAAVSLCASGEAAALMKGSLHSDILLHALVRQGSGLRGERRVSHVFVMDVPSCERPLLVTDAAVNIAPTLDDKAVIVQNAIDFALALGIEQPRVAILSAVETVQTNIPSTLDAAALCKMADRGQIRGGVLDGPLAFDTAVSTHAAAVKHLVSPVAGKADILVVPDLEAGNMLVKELEYLGGAHVAGIVLGARVPVILTSRADGAESRMVSAALAVLLADYRAQGA
ncbi:MAG: bifunctional enoyl-CoA hydratase/phosphate acetyltransferase [Nevskia sp.]|nr:bifunctional enoyl-CoA hydratase/phosphate acetyltransferase [Nevskia sp.]